MLRYGHSQFVFNDLTFNQGQGHPILCGFAIELVSASIQKIIKIAPIDVEKWPLKYLNLGFGIEEKFHVHPI